MVIVSTCASDAGWPVHLAAAPYADATRERIALALGLPRGLDPQETERLIDAAQLRRAIAGPPFSQAARHLRDARKPHELTKRAQVLQQIERHLK